MHELPNLSISGARDLHDLWVTPHCLVYSTTSVGFTTEVLLPIPTFGMAGIGRGTS